MQELRTSLEKSGQSYWRDRTEEQMLAVSAWAAQAEGNREQALKLMRAAADSEDASVKHVAMENRLYPMRALRGAPAPAKSGAGRIARVRGRAQGEPQPVSRPLRSRARRGGRWRSAEGRWLLREAGRAREQGRCATPEITRAKAFVGAR
jgi:hypothetical protein